jgi:hypothetical protein
MKVQELGAALLAALVLVAPAAAAGQASADETPLIEVDDLEDLSELESLADQEPEAVEAVELEAFEHARAAADEARLMVRATADAAGQDAREAEAAAREMERKAREAERQRERAERDQERARDEASRAEESYERGTEALDEGRWDRAVRSFEEVCRRKGSRCDGALYWKAYALGRLGRRPEAHESLAELRKSYPQSRWLNEAKALELETQGASGKPVSPDQGDEELKLLALNSLMASNSSRALPLLEEFLKTNRSPRLQDRALFVLSQSDEPRAREVLLAIARGSQNPDLQTRAVKYLGMSGDEPALRALAEIYATADTSMRRRILESYMIGGDKARVLAAAQGEKDPELRRQAIHLLGALGASPELAQMYKAEPSVEVRRAILHAFVAADGANALMDAAKAEKDAGLRLEAVRTLGALDSGRTGSFLSTLYAAEADAAVRSAVLDAFTAQNNCSALVGLARAEKDPVLRRKLVERLGAIECAEATDFLLEILKK